jgi:hypothetical protein
VREARGRVAELASGVSEEIRTAAVMVTAELLENAIKDGEAVPGCEDVLVHVSIAPEAVTIEVINGASSRDHIAELLERIEQIRRSPSREALYISRLEEMLETPGVSGKLGLYRIGFEGNFDLTCSYEFPVLKVRATRVIGLWFLPNLSMVVWSSGPWSPRTPRPCAGSASATPASPRPT